MVGFFCIPYNIDNVLIIDSLTNTVDYITGLSSDVQKWAGGCLATNGKIYCAPYGRNEVLVIDPSTNTVEYINLPSNLQAGSFK